MGKQYLCISFLNGKYNDEKLAKYKEHVINFLVLQYFENVYFISLYVRLNEISYIVPFGELFHIGGQHSVRGFLFGQIGPKFQGDTIGAKKALFWNVELIFPITGDMTMKGTVFYDGGAGFDNPYVSNVSRANLTGNNFDYRHSVGIGLQLLKPMPIKIDWGFKIDPRKNKLDPEKSETGHEIHFGMTYDW